MEPLATFEGVPLHPDLREFYGSFWGRDGGGRHSGEVASVRIAWNAKELARITRSISAQVGQHAPICVAVTDSDWYFGVDNSTGAVWLCEPGRPPIRQVAQSLAQFLADIQ
jgi:SecY interacting protein Syd